jgi:hypothetical protein
MFAQSSFRQGNRFAHPFVPLHTACFEWVMLEQTETWTLHRLPVRNSVFLNKNPNLATAEDHITFAPRISRWKGFGLGRVSSGFSGRPGLRRSADSAKNRRLDGDLPAATGPRA